MARVSVRVERGQSWTTMWGRHPVREPWTTMSGRVVPARGHDRSLGTVIHWPAPARQVGPDHFGPWPTR